jgi:hypothetical protein
MEVSRYTEPMKLYVIAVMSEDSETPWVVSAWDEYSIDENSDGFDADVAKAKKDHPGAEVRVGVLNMPKDFLLNMFKPYEAKATVES